MDSPYVGQLFCVPYHFAPRGFELCEGQLLRIANYSALFALIGNTFGGDGVTNFALPDLRGRIPVGVGTGGVATCKLGQKDGVESVWLNFHELPAHSHSAAVGEGPAQTNSPVHTFLAPASGGAAAFAAASDGSFMSGSMVQATPPATAGHNNLQPYTVLNWIISVNGHFPELGPETYIGQLMLTAWERDLDYWVPCEGQLLSTADVDNKALFELLGTKYGGDGINTFGVPDLRGRAVIGAGNEYAVGQTGGSVTVTLTPNQIPPHTHKVLVTNGRGTDTSPAGNLLADANGAHYQARPTGALNASVVESTGGNPHENRMPSLGLKWWICRSGFWPTTISNSFIGQMALVPHNQVPEDWMPCDGRLLPLGQAPGQEPAYTALFSLVGNTFGGDGIHNFALPDMRGRVPMGAGQGAGLSMRKLGETGGSAQETIQANQLPAHSHRIRCDTQGATQASPLNGVPSIPNSALYAPPDNNPVPGGTELSTEGRLEPHDNMQPYIALQWVICCTRGMYPTRD